MVNEVNAAEPDRRRTVAWLGAALSAALMPGTCPACWPGYLGLAASLGLGASEAARVPGAVFVLLIGAALGGLGRQAWRRRAWEAAAAAIAGAALLVEARWLRGAIPLRLPGATLLVGSALTSLKRPVPRAPVLITIGRRD